MCHFSIGTHIGHENYVYTKLCNCSKKTNIKGFNSPGNKLLIVLDYCSKNIEEYFHLRKPENIYLSEKYATKYVKNNMNTMVNHLNSMEQGMIGIQEKFIELENERLKQ